MNDVLGGGWKRMMRMISTLETFEARHYSTL